jgi:endonuclease
MSIYEQPTKILMQQFTKERLKPGQIFEKSEAVAWFTKNYPKIRPTTVQMHVEGMAVNSTERKHHPNIKPGSQHDLFFKVGPGKFRLWVPDTDPAPTYRDQLSGQQVVGAVEKAEQGVVEAESEEAADQAFAFERDLRNYLSKNLNVIESGLTLYKDEEFVGIEFPVGGRFIDILAVGKTGDFVVIELKVSRGHEKTIGQLLRYMGWVQKNLASGKPVRGVIVASDITEDLKLAASQIRNVGLFEYELSFKLRALEG